MEYVGNVHGAVKMDSNIMNANVFSHVMVFHGNHQGIVRQFLSATKGLPRGNSELILTALGHSLSNLLVPLRKTTESFLSAPRSSLEYNLYLQSISHIPFRTPESTHTVRSILEHTDELNLQSPSSVAISTTTYTRLIRPSFTPVALLGYLHHRLTHVHPPPELPLPVLLSFLTAYSKLANPSISSVLFAQIHAHPDTSPDTLQHANTLLLAAQSSQQSAYHVLVSRPPSSDSYDPVPFNTSASFHVLAKDLSVPPHSLVRTFLQITASIPHLSLIPLYTSLINGLTVRKRYRTACTFFNLLLKQLSQSNLINLDIPSLSAGINALTRAGNPHHAFHLLQSHYPLALLSPPSTRSSFHNPILPLLTFLTALNRISRPDISTLLFFLYPALYSPESPPPNSLLLNLLLQSARMAIKMDLNIHTAQTLLPDNLKRLLQDLHSRTVPHSKYPQNALNALSAKLDLRTSTLIHQITSSLGDNLGYKHLISTPSPPFGKQYPETDKPHPHPRLQASNLILTHLGHPSRGGLRHFVSSSVYQGIPSATWARVVFLRVLAGLGKPMWEINAPALSFVPNPNLSPDTRPSPKLDSFTHLFTSRQSPDLVPYSPCHFYNRTLWENLQKTSSRKRTKLPFYPSIIPTNSNFFNYLVLLALSHSSSLRPVTLSPNGKVIQGPPKKDTDNRMAVLPPACSLETPLVLAWMRKLNIQPSNSTLALALVMWGEVCESVDASGYGSVVALPLGGRMNEKLGEREYVVLVSYLREWVGEGRLPHWKTLGKWRYILKKIRAGGGLEEEDEEEEKKRMDKKKYKRYR